MYELVHFINLLGLTGTMYQFIAIIENVWAEVKWGTGYINNILIISSN
jgi:hypothetical protein